VTKCPYRESNHFERLQPIVSYSSGDNDHYALASLDILYIHTLLYFEHLSLFIWPCLKEDENFKRKANMQDMFFFFF
jgi:hypothetical protein